jgi:succinoglycan biosynthesis transport protein ExoP
LEADDTIETGGLPDTLRDPRGMLRRRWRWMAPTLVAGLALSTAFAATRQPRWFATAVVMVTTQQIREDLVRTTLQDDLLRRIDALIGEVLSRESLSRLVEKHDPYPDLRAKLSMDDLAALLRADVDFRPQLGMEADPSARLFTLRVEAREPQLAAALANDLAATLVDRSIDRRTREAALAVKFLQGELERAERELREHSRKIREFNEQYRGELPGELTSNLARLERLQQQRQSLALQIAEANTQLAALLAPGTASTLDVSPEASLQALRAQLREREGVLTGKHPEVQWLKRQIESLEQQVETTGASGQPTRAGLVAAAQQTIEELRRQLARTEVELAELDERVARTPARQEELAGLEERGEALRENYRDFLRKVQEGELASSLESAQQGERFAILEEAIPPSQPARSRWIILAAGCLCSIAAALGMGLLLELADPVMISVRQVEGESDLQVLGSVSHIS